MPQRGKVKLETYTITTDSYSQRTTLAEVPIYLDKGTMTFSARHGTVDFQEADGATLKRKLEEHVRRTAALEWRPALAVATRRGTRNHGHDDSVQAGVDVEFYRFYWAPSPRGGVVTARWALAPADRLGQEKALRWPAGAPPFCPPCVAPREQWAPGGDTTRYLPYTETLWEGLQRMRAAVEAIAARVDELVGTEAGQAALAAGDGLALPPAGA